jgi:hypothetical protein
VTALGQSSNNAANLTGTPTGNTMTVLRTTLTPSATALGTLTGRVKSSVDNLATITVTANAGGSAMLNKLLVTFSGNAVSSSVATTTFTLLDQNNVNVTSNSSFNASASSTGCTASSCLLEWDFPTSTAPVVSAGNSYSFTLRVNDSNLVTAPSNTASVSLSATINGTTDVLYYDNTTGSGSTISLPTTLVPVPITTVTFSTGS